MKKFKSLTALALAVSFASATITPQVAEPLTTVQAASKIKLNKKSATIKVGKSVQLKVKGTKKKVKWSSSNSKIAKVSAKGKVTGKKKGTVKITAKVSKKKLTCKVKVLSATKATKKPTATPTTAPAFPNVPTQPNIPVETNTPVQPEATSTTRPTRVPGNPTTSNKPEPTANATTAPVTTVAPSKEEGKQVSLALDFYLEPYDPTRPDNQFVDVNFFNHLEQDVVVETEAYVTTRGEDYPALLLGKPEGETVTIEPTYEGDIYGTTLTYDSWDYVKNGDNCTMRWLPLDENSTLTFFFRVGNQRYKATINFDQKGALYREASDYEQLAPFTSAAPTIAPEETVTPVETEAPVVKETPVATKEPTKAPATTPEVTKEPVALDLEFYLDAYDPTRPNEQFVGVNFVNHLEQDVVVEREAYATTSGVDYPAFICNTIEGETRTIYPEENTIIYYDSWDYVQNGDDADMWWLPLNENSTFTFFFRVGNQRYKATINFDQKGALFYEAEDSEQLVPFTSAAPTTEPEETTVPYETEAPVITETPVPTEEPTTAPAATPEATKEPVALDLEFFLDEYDPTKPDLQFVWVHFRNNLQESIFVENEAYVTTRGENYLALMIDKKEGGMTEVTSDSAECFGYDSWDYVKNGDNCTMRWLPLDENSTFTFFFRIGEKRYKATINFDQRGGLYYESDDTEQLERFVYQENSDNTTTE